MPADRPIAQPAGIDQQIQQILEAHERNPSSTGRALRRLMASHSWEFVESALRRLQAGPDHPAHVVLVSLLAREALLMDPLCDPLAFSAERAISVARTAARVDPQLELNLARRLRRLSGAAAQRVLMILEAVSGGATILSLLTPLLDHSDQKVRSKAVLIIGRALKSPAWAQRELEKEDGRQRANAIEALWGVRSPEARALFARAIDDPNNRAAANAIVGLYKMGDAVAVSLLHAMSRCAEPLLRATAAWAMGETADPRFLPVLERMDPNPRESLGRNIARATERIKAAEAASMARGRVPVWLTQAEDLGDGSRRVRLAVAVPGRAAQELLPTQFVISEDSRPVTDFRVERGKAEERLVVGFALPNPAEESQEQKCQAVEESILRCLRHKRTIDTWAVIRRPDQPVQFSPDKSVLRSTLTDVRSPPTFTAADAWGRAIEAAGKMGGQRNVIALALPPFPDAAELDALANKARAARVAVHFVATGSLPPSSPLASACKATAGILAIAHSAHQIPELCEQVCLSLLHRYELVYSCDADAGASLVSEVRVQIYAGCGYGEASAQLGLNISYRNGLEADGY